MNVLLFAAEESGKGLSFSNPWMLLAAAAAAFVVSKLAVKGDTRVEERRRTAAKVSGKLNQLGLSTLAGLLEDYAVGDYSGMFGKVRELRDILTDKEQRKQSFRKVLRALLEEYMEDADERPGLLKLIEDLRLRHDAKYAEKVKGDQAAGGQNAG